MVSLLRVLFRYIVPGLFLILVGVSAWGEPERLSILVTDDTRFLPLHFDVLGVHSSQSGVEPIHIPRQIYRPARLPGDTALYIRGYNTAPYQDVPSQFSFMDYTNNRIIDDNPIWMTIHDYRIISDQVSGDTVIIAFGHRNDTAYAAKLLPTGDSITWLFLATGEDLTGDGTWHPEVGIHAVMDYDYDGRQELLVKVHAARDLRPRLLLSIEVEGPSIQWSLPVAGGIRNPIVLAGDSAEPRLVFTTSNSKQGGRDARFSDMWGYFTVLDANSGRIVLNRVVNMDYGGTGMIPSLRENEFFVSNSVGFLAPDDTVDFPEEVYRVSRVSIDGTVLGSAEFDNQVRSLWPASVMGIAGDGLFVTTTRGNLYQLDSALQVVAFAPETEVHSFITQLVPEAGGDTLIVLGTTKGAAVMDREFDQLGLMPGSAGYIEPLVYEGVGGQRVFMSSGGGGSTTFVVMRRSIFDYVRTLVVQYDIYLLLSIIVLLAGLVYVNHRRYRTLRKLRQREANFQAFCEASPDLIFDMNRDGVFLDYQTRDSSQLLFPPEQFVGRPVTEVMGAEAGARILDQIRRALSTNSMQTLEYAIERDGRAYSYEARVAPVSKTEVLAVIRDITDQRMAEEELRASERALRASEQRFRSLVANVPGAIYRCALDDWWTMEFISEEVGSITGYPASDFINNERRAFSSIIHLEDREMLTRQIHSAVSGHQPYFLEYRIVHQSGEIRWVSEQGQALFSSEGEVVCLDGVMFDITEQKQADCALREYEEKTRAQYKAIPVPTYTWQRAGDDFVLIDYNDAAVEITDGGVAKMIGIRCREMYADQMEIFHDIETCFRERRTINREMQYHFVSTDRTLDLSIRYVYIPNDMVLIHTEDITERVHSRQQLQTRLRYEAGLARCSRTLLASVAMEDTINEALKHLLEASRVCRVYLFENFEDGQLGLCMRQTNEVCREGVESYLDDPVLQCLPYSGDREYVRAMLSRGQAFGGAVSTMPLELRGLLESQSVESLLLLPVFVGGEWYGFVGFDDTRDERVWNEDDIRLLRTAAEMIGSYLEMRQATRALTEERDFSDSILQTANSLILCLDEDCRVTVFNDELEKVTGWKREEVLGRYWFDVGVPKRYFRPEHKNWLKWISDNPADRYERELVTKSGEEVCVLWSNSTLVNPHTGKKTAIAIGYDITDRKKAEAARQENEEKYRAVMQQSADSIYLADAQTGRILEANLAMQGLLGYSAEELQQLTMFDFIDHPEDDIRDKISRVLDDSLSTLAERYWRTRDGRRISVEVGVSAVEYGGKRVLCIVARDISERLAADAQLRRQEEQYRLLVENVQAAIVLVDADGKFLFANRKAAQATGRTPEELVGLTQWEVFPQELADRQVENIRRVIHTGQEFSSESRVLLQGEWSWFFNNLQPYREATGETTAALVIAQDITEHRQAKEALKESEQRFRELADLLPQTIFEADSAGRLTYTNRAGLAATGYSEDDIERGIQVQSLFVDSERETLMENFYRRLRGEEPTTHEYTQTRKDGSTFPVLIYAATVLRDDKPVGLRGIVIDITEIKKAEEQVRRANQLRYQQLKEIAGGVSHEIYNSLYPAVISLEKLGGLLADASLSDPDRCERLLAMTSRAVQRALGLTETVTNYSRLETQQKTEPVELSEIIQEVLESNRHRIEDGSVSVSAEVGTLPSILASRSHMYSLINNIVINSLDALTDSLEKELSISGQYRDGRVEIDIADSGPGIPFEILDRVFEPFFTTKPDRGTGLGLAMAKKIVELYGGRLTVESTLDNGTRFRILLPTQDG